MALDCVSSQKDLDMILTADYHTHSPYSHGKNTIFENAEQAKKIGLKAIAISDHGFTHLAYGIKRREMDFFMAFHDKLERYMKKQEYEMARSRRNRDFEM